MEDTQIIIDDIDVSFCTHHYNGWSNLHRDNRPMCECGYDRECEPKKYECHHYVKCLEQKCEDLMNRLDTYCYDCDVAERMRKVTYAATGGRLSYANYTVEAIEQAYNDQLRIDVEYRTKELEEELSQLRAENTTYRKMLEDGDFILALTEIRTGERQLWYNRAQKLEELVNNLKETLQFYNNTTIGEHRGNGIFEFVVYNKNTVDGKLTYLYDTNPAKKALLQIDMLLGQMKGQ